MLVVEFGDVRVKLSSHSILTMFDYLQDDPKKSEAGGILLGYYIDQNNLSITDISIPSNNDKRARYSFYRAKINAQNIINKFFKISKGKKIYLGEWHTHPEDYPTPSSLDRKSIITQIRKGRLNSDKIISIILGRKGYCALLVTKSGIVSEIDMSFENISSKIDFK